MKNTPHPSEYQGIGPLFDKPKSQTEGWVEVIRNLNKSDFDGQTYEPKFDATRLRGEMARVYKVMIMRGMFGHWLTLREISDITGYPEASISARLRDLRKAKFGSHTVNRRRRGEASRGIWEYQLL